MVEAGISCIGNPDEMSALEHLVKFGLQNRLDTTVVLFPRKPDTLTEKAKVTTLREFHDRVVALTEPLRVRVADLSSSTPLKSDEFMDDFDHVSAIGNQKFAKWALAGPLAFLLQPPLPPHEGGTP